MQFTWHLLFIVAAVLIGVCLFQRGEKTASMSPEQMKEADMYRMWAYVLWGVAVAVAVYYYMNMSQKASMCSGNKAYMYRPGKAHMYGDVYDVYDDYD